MKDNIYSQPLGQVPRFHFDAQVAGVFDDMIKRSVPGYQEVLAMQANLIRRIYRKPWKIFDLGCSTGNLFALLGSDFPLDACVGVDPSAPMLEKAKQRFSSLSSPVWCLQGAEETDLGGAGIVVLNYVLQFLEPAQREPLLARIFEELEPGGFLLLSEKVRHTHPLLSDLEVEVHHDHKRAMGYSDLEIQQKRDAIEDYLRPDSLDLHLARLKNIGFQGVDVVFKWMNFCSIMAVKA